MTSRQHAYVLDVMSDDNFGIVAALLSPTHFKQALHEAIEVLPDESRLIIGGDNWHVEETYGAIQLTRRLFGEVLQEKVDTGYFKIADARRLAGKILSDNASQFFGEQN